MVTRRTFIATALGSGISLLLPTETVAEPTLQVSRLPIGTIVPSMDSAWRTERYRILVDGNYWLPLWIKDYFLQVRSCPVMFSLIGYTYGRRDIHNSVYGPEGEFALPYIVHPLDNLSIR